MSVRFGIFELDEEAGELRMAGEPVAIQPKPLALLAYLIRERDRVVPTDELLEALWPGTIVSPGSLTRAVSHARRAIEDTHRGALLRSFPRRGYRFTGDVVDTRAQVADAPPTAPGQAQVAAQDALFVGRGEALARLGEAWAGVASGRGGIVLVTGPAGIGKTRLTEVFARDAAQRGPLVVVGRCSDHDGVPAFWLWAQILRRLVEEDILRDEVRALAGAGELADLLPGIAASDPARPAPDDLPAGQQRFLFFDAVTRVLQASARRRPLVLILEDLQWAGQPSLRLLEHLACELAGVPLLIVATVRDESRERGHPVDRTTSVLRQQECCSQVALAGLSRGEVGQLLARAIGGPAPADLTSELFARTEGVPFFVGEAIRLLEERGELQHPERIPRRGVTLPAQAVDLVRRSLDGLSAPCSELIGAAAIAGREFTLTTVAAIARVERADALDWLDEAIRAGVVEEQQDGAARYRFSHALFQEAVYSAMPAGTRARLHARAAERLEARYGGDLEPVISELAHHHARGIAVGDPERAFEVAVCAAQSAERQYAYEQVALHYEQAVAALDHCESVDPSRRLATLLSLGEAHRLAGERDERREVFRLAMESARSLGRHRDFARAAIGFCDVAEWSPHDLVARAVVEEALAAQDEEAGVERARLTTRIGYLEVEDRELAEPFGREGVRLALASGDPEAIQEAIYVLHYIIAGPDDMEERSRQIGQLVDSARACHGRDTAVIAVLDVGCDALTVGDMATARRFRDEAGELAGRYASPSMQWHTAVWDTGLAFLEGRFDEVEQRAQDALLIGRRIRHPYARACFGSQLSLLARERGDHEQLLQLQRPTLTRRRGATEWVMAVVARSELALGNEAAAQGLFDQLAAGGFEDIPRNIRWPGTMPEIALLCAELEDAARARQLLAVLGSVEQHHGVLPVPINYSGPYTRCMARLSEVVGASDDALALYEEALESASAMGARPMQAHIQHEYGRLLGRSGDATRARSLLEESHRLSQEIGMTVLTERVGSALARS
jgi:DNA-binding winged helix-turn-helix (wHTH) protein/tetratricopeptide (TPR) repeat protein